MNSITQDMMFCQSLAAHSKRPHHHPNEHTPEEIELIKRYRRRNPQLRSPSFARLHKTCGKPVQSDEAARNVARKEEKDQTRSKTL